MPGSSSCSSPGSARASPSREDQPGELVAFYGYAAFLVIPLRTAAEAVEKLTRAHVGAGRMLEVLSVERDVAEPDAPADEPPPGVPLADARSGLVVEPGSFTCLVSADPDEAAEIADRLGRFGDGDGRDSDSVVLGGVELADLHTDDRPATDRGQ